MPKLFKFPRLNQRGVVHLIPLFVLLIGIVAGVYLVKHPQIFKPKASAEPIKFSGSCLAAKSDGTSVLTCNSVQLKFTSPLEPGQTSDGGFQLVKTAYANHGPEREGWYCDNNKVMHDVKYPDTLIGKYQSLVPWNFHNEWPGGKCTDQGKVCKVYPRHGYTQGAGCFGKDEQPGETETQPAGNQPVNSFPVDNGEYNLASDGAIGFVWSPVTGARSYRLFINKNDNFYNSKTANYILSASDFEDGKTYHWWVDALGFDGIKLKDATSDGTDFTVHKTAAAANYVFSCDESKRVLITRDSSKPGSPKVGSIDCTQEGLVCREKVAGSPYGAECVDESADTDDSNTNSSYDCWFNQDASHCYKGACADGVANCGYNDKCVYHDYGKGPEEVNCETGKPLTPVPGPGRPSGPTGPGGGVPAGAIPGGAPASGVQAGAVGTQVGTCQGAPIIQKPDGSKVVDVPCRDNPPVCGGIGERLEGYSWIADCSSTCGDNSNCPESTSGYVNPKTSNWCYGFKSGNRCLMLRYDGDTSGTSKGTNNCTKHAPGEMTDDQLACFLRLRPTDVVNFYKTPAINWCADSNDDKKAIFNDWARNAGTPAGDKQQVAGCFGGAAGSTPTPTPNAAQKVTKKFRFSEQRASLDTLEWRNYTAGGSTVPHNFTGSIGATYTIFVQFMDNNNQIILFPDGQNFKSQSITLVDPASLNPATPTPTPISTANIPLDAQFLVNPTSVTRTTAGAFPKVQITVIGANKSWTLYYQNKPGANCGGSCDVNNGWTAFSAFASMEGGNGAGGVGNSPTISWTAPAATSGIHTIALIDLDTGKIISKDIEFKENPADAGWTIPAGSACSAYEVTTVCGGTTKTYDKCTDEKNQTGTELCKNGALKFYCVGSTNPNCDSRYDGTKVVEGSYPYLCSTCPNLRPVYENDGE